MLRSGLAGCVVLAACEADPRDPAFTVTDSAGVVVAESRAPAWNQDEGWRLAPEPALEIGMVEGDEALQFSMVVSAWRTADGRIVVVDRGVSTGMIRIFDAQGALLHGTGSRGEGPGEFQMIFAAGPYLGDSIALWDVFQERLTVLDAQGRTGRTRTIPVPLVDESTPGGGLAMVEQGAVVGTFDDGSILVLPSRTVSQGGEPIRWERRYVVYSPGGEPTDTLGPLPRPEPLAQPTPEARRLPRPYAAPFVRGTYGDRLYVAAGDANEIQVWTRGGALERVIRVTGRDLTLTEDHREAYRRLQRLGAGDDDEARRRVEQGLRDLVFPRRRPAWAGTLLVDPADHVWIERYRMPGGLGPAAWDVFGPDGRLLGTVEMPERLRVHYIGREHVLGTWAGEMDVPFVRLYRIERP